MSAPRVFISYSHDSDAHKIWVRELGQQLQARGIEVTLDQWDLVPGADVAAFMDRGIAEADRVLMVCSAEYVKKAESGAGGVGYERLIVSAAIYARIDTVKFIPLIRNNALPHKTPSFIGARLYVDFTDDARFDAALEELARAIHNVPAHTRPPLGGNPFSPLMPTADVGVTTTATSPTASTSAWFTAQAAQANAGLQRQGRSGALQVHLQLAGTERWSQLLLYNSVKTSEISTFGWPIGIVLDNREEFRPRPRADGVYAEVAISDKGFSQAKSYDYWALRDDGAFYVLQSLFEDERAENALFFNTRIVRVTEALLFGARLYTALGLDAARIVTVRMRHQGLRGRTLASSNPSRSLSLARVASDDAVEVERNLRIEQMASNVTEPVMAFCEPLFMLFDFQQFNRKVYDDIVSQFERGQVT